MSEKERERDRSRRGSRRETVDESSHVYGGEVPGRCSPLPVDRTLSRCAIVAVLLVIIRSCGQSSVLSWDNTVRTRNVIDGASDRLTMRDV